MKRASSKKGKNRRGLLGSIAEPPGGGRTERRGVFLLYASSRGAAFVDRTLYVPEEWARDRVRCREAGIADSVSFATKGEVARQRLARAFAAGTPAAWVAGDTVSGYDELCLWLDSQQKNDVMAVPETYVVWIARRQQPVGLLAALLPKEAWWGSQQGKEARGHGSTSGPGSS